MENDRDAQEFDVVVVGAGLAGAAAALALGRMGLAVGFVAPPAERPDHRTTALLMPSIRFLNEIDVWDSLADRAAALATMRLVDGTRRLLRAPTVTFHAGEIGAEAFGYNIANADLVAALLTQVSRLPDITTFPVPATGARQDANGVTVDLADGTAIAARLAVAADGRNSVLRQAARIGARTWRYRQAAIVTTFKHRFPHENISTEFHTEDGPFTQVPLPGDRSSLVWVMQPRDARILADLGAENLSRAIEERMQSMLGAVTVDGPLQQFPITGMIAHAFATGRTVLVGEAGHVIAPIGAQGLNLGLRDVAALAHAAEAAGNALETVPGSYGRARRLDVTSRTIGVDALNRSLLSDFLPVHLARAAGLSALMRVTPLRRFLMREGMEPGSSLRALAPFEPFSALRNRLRESRNSTRD
ncbi:MAG: UbiH/UbiF family hydroxylase [Pararhizobium sp.]